MKVLVVSSKHRDMLALTLWDGLQQVLGEGNVVDAVGSPSMHRSQALESLGESPSEGRRHCNSAFSCQALGGTREGRTIANGDSGFDLLVIHSCFADDFGWQVPRAALNRLKQGGKVAWVDGADDSYWVIDRQFATDAVFRKEISCGFSYPYGDPLHQLGFAAPERWFYGSDVPEADRDIDVLFIGNPTTNGADRQGMIEAVFRCDRHHRAVISTVGLGWAQYFALLRRTKLALCPSSAGGADSLRTYEAVSQGAIPVFVEYPSHVREPWFPPETSVTVEDVNNLHGVLDSCLAGHDLAPMRSRLREWALKNHTTRARALKVLSTLGFREGVDW